MILNRKILGLGILLLTFAVSDSVLAKEDADAGKNLFTTNCTSCHAIDKKVVGPALGGVDKVDKIDWIIRFVKGSQAMVKSGDKRAVQLFTENNQTVMPDHPQLSDQDIKNIFAYIDQENDKLASSPKTEEKEYDQAPYPGGPHSWLHNMVYLDIPGHYEPLTSKDRFAWFAIFSVVFLGLIILVSAINIQSYVSKEKKDDEVSY